MADKKLINKIKRQCTLTEDEVEDFEEYDKIVKMEWDGIPGLSAEEYYVEYISTIGRDIIQQMTNVWAVSRPKWDVFPRGLGDADTAEEFERVIEWYMWMATQSGRKPFQGEAMTHIGKYGKVCGQIEWEKDENGNDYFCVKNFHPGTVKYELGNRLQWVSVVNNVYAVSILEHWNSYAEESSTENARTKKSGGIYDADKIGAALKKIEKLVEDDEEQRMMYVDYTDDKRRYTYCYPVSSTEVDYDLGYDDDGNENKDLIVIQDKENALGFINWAIAESEGDPLLAPLHKGHYYDNINDLRTMKATALFRRGLFPMFIQEGRPDADAEIDFQSDTIKAPQGARLTQTAPPGLDPGYDAMEAQLVSQMNQSMAVQNVSQVSVSNVQNSTLDSQIKLWLMQFEPYKRAAEKYYEQLAHLMFKYGEKKGKTLKAVRSYSKGGAKLKGMDIVITPEQMSNLYIKCTILPNNPTDRMQLANEFSIIKQSGMQIDEGEYIERMDIGDPDAQREKYEKSQIRQAALMATIEEITNKAKMSMAEFQAQLQVKVAEAEAQLQAQVQGAGNPSSGAPAGAEPATTNTTALPSDAATSGTGFDAASGGMSPQAAVPGVTQGMR